MNTLRRTARSQVAPNMSTSDFTIEHPQDVLQVALDMMNRGKKVCLAVLVDSMGGAVRNPGALMAIDHSGDFAGYLSGGCIDADVVSQAVTALEDGHGKLLRYGQGSPFPDILLPCGGSLDIAVDTNLNKPAIMVALEKLKSRKRCQIDINMPDRKFTINLIPKLKLRIAGRGADAIALARLSKSLGIDCRFQSPDEECCKEATQAGIQSVEQLVTPNHLPKSHDDAYTAFVLMFHDREWEVPLLVETFRGNAFYIGAVGSRRTHESRCAELKNVGCDESQIRRIFGPIGLIPSMRDASMLAISAMSEIVSEFHKGR